MKNLKNALLGYDILQSSNRESIIHDIKTDLTNTIISEIGKKASKSLFGSGFDHAELIIRQYILIRFADLDFNKQILASFVNPQQELVLKLPKQWGDIIATYGVKISKSRSSIKWRYYILTQFMKNCLLLIKTICRCILRIITIRMPIPNYSERRYSYFTSLSKNNLPQPDQSGISHDIISWYVQWAGKSDNIDLIYHNVQGDDKKKWQGVKLCYLEHPILPLQTKKENVQHAIWCFRALFTAAFSVFTGHWWNVLLLEESIAASVIRFQNPKLLAREYLFHNSGWIYRPLWTYEAKKKGSKIHFYFYSTNCETIASTTKKTQFHYGYQCMNWPHYLVWDAYQARFVRDAVGKDANVSVVGPIWFSTSSKELPVLPHGAISVFDIQPMRDAFYKTLGITFDYYIPKVCTQFLADIFEVSTSLDLTMAWKRKRDIGKKVHPVYRNFVEKLESSANFIAIDANISAIKLIEKSSMVISMPFTSTAILARELKKPSIFYDPLNMLQKDDPAAHGIQIISGIEELKQWVVKYI